MSDTTKTGSDPSPQIQLLRTIYSTITARLLTIAAELEIPDLIGDGSLTAAQLAAAAEVDPDALYRMLRTLAAGGIFTEVSDRTFANTDLSNVLRANGKGSIRDVILELGSTETFATLARFEHSVKTGEPTFDQVYPADWWSWLNDRPARAEVFNRAQAITARQVHTRALDPYDMSDVECIVDIGGGHGDLVARTVTRYPGMRGIVFDQPDVVVGAKAKTEAAGLSDRVEIVGGNFFESVPGGGDLYLLSMIMHDWNDEPAAAILTNIRTAMRPGARVLIVDALIPEGDTPHPGKFVDILMLMYYAGRERTEAQFAALLASAGLRLVETRASTGPTSLIIAEAAN